MKNDDRKRRRKTTLIKENIKLDFDRKMTKEKNEQHQNRRKQERQPAKNS